MGQKSGFLEAGHLTTSVQTEKPENPNTLSDAEALCPLEHGGEHPEEDGVEEAEVSAEGLSHQNGTVGGDRGVASAERRGEQQGDQHALAEGGAGWRRNRRG